jgi:hypothetical protein
MPVVPRVPIVPPIVPMCSVVRVMHVHRRMRKLGLLCWLVVGGACAEQAAFTPTENVSAVGHGGQPAAAYRIRDQPNGDPQVIVTVWSNGARESHGATLVDVTLSVRNTGAQAVSLRPDALALEAYANDGSPLPPGRIAVRPEDVAPERPDGLDPRRFRVEPGHAQDIPVQFALPASEHPLDIGSLRLRWALEYDGGQRYVQFTEFARVPEPVYVAGYASFYDPVYGYYDPFFFPQRVHYHVPVGRVIVRDHRVGRR